MAKKPAPLSKNMKRLPINLMHYSACLRIANVMSTSTNQHDANWPELFAPMIDLIEASAKWTKKDMEAVREEKSFYKLWLAKNKSARKAPRNA